MVKGLRALDFRFAGFDIDRIRIEGPGPINFMEL